MTTNRNFPSYTSPKLFSTLKPSPPRSYNPATLLPASSGVWGVHFNWSLLTSEARPITWLIQMSARSLPFFYLFPSRINLRVSCSGRRLNRTAWTEWIGCYSQTCQSGEMLSGDPAVRPLRATMHHHLRKLCRGALCIACSEGMSVFEKDIVNHLSGLFSHMSRENTFFLVSKPK